MAYVSLIVSRILTETIDDNPRLSQLLNGSYAFLKKETMISLNWSSVPSASPIILLSVVDSASEDRPLAKADDES